MMRERGRKVQVLARAQLPFACDSLIWNVSGVLLHYDAVEMTAVGCEPTPLRTGALSQRLRPLGQTVLNREFEGRALRCSRLQLVEHLCRKGEDSRDLSLGRFQFKKCVSESYEHAAGILKWEFLYGILR